MKVIFAGTPAFAASALAALHAAGFSIPLVLTQPDRPAGRGMQLHASAVKQFALTHDLPIAQPPSLRLNGNNAAAAQQAHDLLLATPHDVMVVAAYGLILPASVLRIAQYGCINIHASLLPRWRGAAPIQRAIEAGDSETGVTIMQMESGLDTGPIRLMQHIPITAEDNSGSLHDKLALLGSTAIVDALNRLKQHDLPLIPQPDTGVCYAAKITKEEARLDFTQAAASLERKIRAFNPAPGATAMLDGIPIKLWRAQCLATSPSVGAGHIVAADAHQGVVVACGQGLLRVTELQKPGGKRLPAAEFLAGFPMAGKRFD